MNRLPVLRATKITDSVSAAVAVKPSERRPLRTRRNPFAIGKPMRGFGLSSISKIQREGEFAAARRRYWNGGALGVAVYLKSRQSAALRLVRIDRE